MADPSLKEQDQIYLIVKGEAQIIKKYQKKYVYISKLYNHSFFGEELLFDNQDWYNYMVIADSEIVVLICHKEMIKDKIPLNYMKKMSKVYRNTKAQRNKFFEDYIIRIKQEQQMKNTRMSLLDSFSKTQQNMQSKCKDKVNQEIDQIFSPYHRNKSQNINKNEEILDD